MLEDSDENGLADNRDRPRSDRALARVLNAPSGRERR
jgi:hypothetical protein